MVLRVLCFRRKFVAASALDTSYALQVRTRSVTLPTYIASKASIEAAALRLLEPELPIAIRLMGIRVSSFSMPLPSASQPTLSAFMRGKRADGGSDAAAAAATGQGDADNEADAGGEEEDDIEAATDARAAAGDDVASAHTCGTAVWRRRRSSVGRCACLSRGWESGTHRKRSCTIARVQRLAYAAAAKEVDLTLRSHVSAAPSAEAAPACTADRCHRCYACWRS